MSSGVRPYFEKWPFNDIDLNVGPYDNLPLIWKEFKNYNYSTGFCEDFPEFGLFNFLAKGFVKEPTDWYTRPLWLQISNELKFESLTYCYNQKPKLEIFLKTVKQYINKMNSLRQPFFLFSFYIQITHNDFNKAQNLDSYIADFINEYKDKLEDTIFILMGDHGNRFGPILETTIGRIESRMPFFNIHLPKKLLDRHQHLAEYLTKNKERLTTWLDIHELLKDIARSNFEPIENGTYSIAYSPWRQIIPSNRTCDDAKIPPLYCVCDERQTIKLDHPLAIEAAQKLVETVNTALNAEKKNCQVLSLLKIKNAEIVTDIYTRKENWNIIELTVSMSPSNGIFRAQMIKKTEWELLGDISRLDEYGKQSLCIQDKILRKYCFCY